MAIYHRGNRELQERFDTRRLADRIADRVHHGDFIDADDAAFIRARDMLFLATADAEGRPQCSYKGGAPGFVEVLDEHTVRFPIYDGNGMFLSAGNVLVNPHVGMLFIDFYAQRPRRLRLNGVASVEEDEGAHAGAQFLLRVRATEVFPNCPRYIHRMALVERSKYVPAVDGSSPEPEWKRSDWACDVLPRA